MHCNIDHGSNWVNFLKDTYLNTAGTLTKVDDQNNDVLIEWHSSDILSSNLANFKKHVCDLAASIQAPLETHFLRSHPKAVHEDVFLKGCLPLFAKGYAHVDWAKAEETIKSTIKQFYLMDLSIFGDDVIKPLMNDVYFFASIKEVETNELTGFFIASVTPALDFGNIKVINLAVSPSHKDQGLEKVLISSLSDIVPMASRYFHYVRPTSDYELSKLAEIGFTKDSNPINDPYHAINSDNLIFLEYNVKNDF